MNPETRIYRFFDFFAMVDTIRNRRLRFAAPSTFPDKNEGLEIIYNSFRAAVESNDGSYSGIASQEEILRLHNILKQSAFVCSWAREADSVALWSLYSADRCGVRISSTVSKLQAAIDAFARSNSMQSQFERSGQTEGVSYAFVQGATVTEVSYQDLRSIHEEILGKGQSQQLLASQKRNENFELWTLKDKAYGHEGEIRGIVQCGCMTPSESKGSYMDLAPWLDGNQVYVDVPDDFVDAVAIDPRCPRYKREIIEGFLRDQKISSVQSKAFGYLPDELDFVASRKETLPIK